MSDPYPPQLKPVQAQFERAMALAQQQKYQESLDTYLGCLKMASRDNLPLPLRFVASVLINTGFCQIDLGSASQAFELYRSAEKLLQKDSGEVLKVCTKYKIQIQMTGKDDLRPVLGELYDSMGLGYDVQGNPEEALAYYKRSLAISKELGSGQGAVVTYQYMANSYRRRGMWSDLQGVGTKLLQYSLKTRAPKNELAARRMLAQAYANQNQAQKTIEELEEVVSLAQRLEDPGLAQDRQLLAQVRQMIAQPQPPVQKSNPPKPVPAPAPTPPVRKAAPSAQPKQSPVPREKYLDLPLQKMFEKVTVQIVTERGAPQPTFTIQTAQIDETAQLLRDFQLNIMPVNVPLLSQLPLPASAKLPKNARLMLEWSVDDLNPTMIACEQVIADNMIDKLNSANKASGSINIMLESKGGLFSKSQTVPVPGVWNSYWIDWSGNLGIATLLRQSSTKMTAEPLKAVLESLYALLKVGGSFTGIYTEIGMIHRLLDNYLEAVECYETEIKASRQSNGLPGVGAVRAINNLGVAYKKMGELDMAQGCFRAALQLQPNYFESLVNLSAILDTDDHRVTCEILARAYRIRPADPIWSNVMENFSQGVGIPARRLFDTVQDISQFINLSERATVDPASFYIPGLEL